jgi:hypothetical protein
MHLVNGQQKDSWQVVTRPTAADHLEHRVGGVYHENNGGFAGALAELEAALGPPDNHYEGTILGPGGGLYRRET